MLSSGVMVGANGLVLQGQSTGGQRDARHGRLCIWEGILEGIRYLVVYPVSPLDRGTYGPGLLERRWDGGS